MSEKRTFVFQNEGGGQEETKKIEIDKTVKELLNLYLEGKSTDNSDNIYAFMVGANVLTNKRFINTPIKNLRFLKPNAVIKVREVDTKAGGRF